MTTPDVSAFRRGRDYAALFDLTPRSHSSGGKERLGRISKVGNFQLCRLLYPGAMAGSRPLICHASRLIKAAWRVAGTQGATLGGHRLRARSKTRLTFCEIVTSK
ncbi:transposase [Thioclava sp. GXIMD4215]|uniref:transposase n=1 Tax=Thioclava sp. GXIMD4215 TaxID=3131928 RepID=UPI003873368C